MNTALKKKPSQKRSQERVGKILRSCSKLLEEDGLQGLTMPKLAKAAEVSVGSLYQYFDNKQAVMQALYEDYLAALRYQITDFLKNIEQHPHWKEGIAHLLERVFKAEQEGGPLAEINQALKLYPELEALDQRHSEEVSELMIQALKHYRFPGTKTQLKELVFFSYSINIGTWSYRTRYHSARQLKQSNRWELLANIAVLEDYLESFKQ